MQDTLIKEKPLERLQRIRTAYYNQLVRDLKLLECKKKVLIKNYTITVREINSDMDKLIKKKISLNSGGEKR